MKAPTSACTRLRDRVHARVRLRNKDGEMAMSVETMIATARSFNQGAYRCNQSLPGDSYDARKLIVPAVVCHAFSLEVYLKFLLKISMNIESREHDLKTLYMMLDESTRNEIETKVGYEKNIFENNIDLFKKAFIEWRYFYEEGNAKVVNLEFVRKMVEAIEEIVQRSGFPYP
jgi:hypothetical protein